MIINSFKKALFLVILVTIIQDCTQKKESREQLRAMFYQDQYYEHNSRIYNVDEKISFDEYMAEIAKDGASGVSSITEMVRDMLGDTVVDKYGELRIKYLSDNPDLPDYIRDVIKKREFIMGMTLLEFWLSAGDSTVLYKAGPGYFEGHQGIDIMEHNRAPYYGYMIRFRDGFLAGWGIS